MKEIEEGTVRWVWWLMPFYPNTLGAKTGGYHVLEARALE